MMVMKIVNNFQVIAGKIIVLQAWVQGDQIGVQTEICPFCRQRHSHGTGGANWGELVEIVDGIRTLGHRVRHCVPRGVKITLADGTVVCNDDGYYLGIGDQQLVSVDELARQDLKETRH